MIYVASDYVDLPTLCVGQCCSLKEETPHKRIWVCRVGGGITIERYDRKLHRWYNALGDCYATAVDSTDEVAH